MNVSLVFTVLNEAGTVERLMQALDAQTRPPDEVVVMDGGSTDGTLEHLRDWAGRRRSVIVGVSAGANIALGRNLAIERAEGPVIAVTDAGCVPDPRWLEEITAPFKEDGGPHVVMGFYRAEPKSTFEALSACLVIPEADEIKPDKFMPSSRSVAFTKRAWTAAGRYPEWVDIGEDMFFNFKVRRAGLRRQFAPEAVVAWRPRPTLRSFLSAHFKYARGDARAGMYLQRHVLRFFAYAALVGLTPLWLLSPLWSLVPAGAGLLWLAPAYKRAVRRLGFGQVAVAVAVLPALQVLVDGAKIGGYLSGIFKGRNK